MVQCDLSAIGDEYGSQRLDICDAGARCRAAPGSCESCIDQPQQLARSPQRREGRHVGLLGTTDVNQLEGTTCLEERLQVLTEHGGSTDASRAAAENADADCGEREVLRRRDNRPAATWQSLAGGFSLARIPAR